ncbi:Cerato-platanin [Hypoxylon sp. FL1150]|nr:Cerato-platanin [Hypoxylon sp. FL1150]
MQFTKIAQLLSLVAASSAITVSYDTAYDDASRSLTTVACSTGQYGLITRYGWQTQGDIPSTYLGAADTIAGYNSPSCGTCYELSYSGKTVNVYAIDHAGAGFNIAVDAMNALTNGQAVALGRIDATSRQVELSACGITA